MGEKSIIFEFLFLGTKRNEEELVGVIFLIFFD